MNAPRITFLLPVYNNAATVAATLDSILAQTESNFELLIIDDASTDAGPVILHSYADSRIRLFRNDSNLEIAATLNRGLTLARANYIARIDADDLCLSHRALTQADFLDANPSIAVVGSYIETFTEESSTHFGGGVIKYPTDPPTVAAALIFRNPLAHPAVMLRKSSLDAHSLCYDESFRRSQDYDLWARCTEKKLSLANIPEVLLRYRIHPHQASQKEAAFSLSAAAAIRLRLLHHLSLTPTPEQKSLHENLSQNALTPTPAFIASATIWLTTLATANTQTQFFSHEPFLKTLTARFVTLHNFANKTASLSPIPP